MPTSLTYEAHSKPNMIKYYRFLSFSDKTASADFSSVSYRPNLLSSVEIGDKVFFSIDYIESDSKLSLNPYCKATAEKNELFRFHLQCSNIIRTHDLNFWLISSKRPLLLELLQL